MCTLPLLGRQESIAFLDPLEGTEIMIELPRLTGNLRYFFMRRLPCLRSVRMPTPVSNALQQQLLFFNNGLRQFFTGKEAYTIFRWNLDDFSVAWIDSFACSTLAHFEGAKAY